MTWRAAIPAHRGPVLPLLTPPCRALGDPDFKQPRRLVEAEPDVARVELRPRSDAFMVLGRCVQTAAVPHGSAHRTAVPCSLLCGVRHGVLCSVL